MELWSLDIQQERFKNFRLQVEYDTWDPKDSSALRLDFLKIRSKVVEIVAAKDLVFALSHSGVCSAFCRRNNKRICLLNIHPDEVIRSLFYNKNNHSLITVSVYASDHFSSLKCRYCGQVAWTCRTRPKVIKYSDAVCFFLSFCYD